MQWKYVKNILHKQQKKVVIKIQKKKQKSNFEDFKTDRQ